MSDPTTLALPADLPLLALRSTIVFPGGRIAVQVASGENLSLLASHPEEGALVVCLLDPEDRDGAPLRADGRIGVVARLTDRGRRDGGMAQVTLVGLSRVRAVSASRDEVAGYSFARVEAVDEVVRDAASAKLLMHRVVLAADARVEVDTAFPAELPALLRREVSRPSRFADLAAARGALRPAEKDEAVQRLDVIARLEFLAERWEREAAKARVHEEVRQETERRVDRHHREFFLRQQLQAIKSELGEADLGEGETVDLLRRIEEAELPEHIAAEARREIDRLRALSTASSEHQVLRNYVEWILTLPWRKRSGDGKITLEKVESALDGRHYGLNEAKERILEYLAVRQLRGDRGSDPHGPILCFVGPPGTGKTSLGEAIAASIGRAFYRISVGGVRDEAEIRGHRRTYVGSLPGLLLQAMRRVQVNDPVLMIDEIDKMTSGGPSGDPTAAMLEVLDPTQNNAFTDHYLNLPFDLSGVLFICTANNLFDIPHALRDRLEVIRIAGYTVEEKVEIAWRYLLPRLFDEHGITDLDLQFTDESLSVVANRYAREAGLRTFERHIAALMRKRAKRKAEGEAGAWIVDQARIEEVLGPPRWAPEAAEQEPEVGTVTGLAWTANGGELMTIEALLMPGTGKLIVTGQLGDVMRESVDAASSYVRSRAKALRVADPEMRSSDLHVHFPAGSVPKDGPSAGVAVTLAIASVMSRRPVRRDVAVTGEVTLRGRVLEIGGVKEKVLAAYRAGLRSVVLPAANEKDLRDIPAEVRAAVTFRCVSTMEDVIEAMLLPPRPNGFAEDLPLFDEVSRSAADVARPATGGADAPADRAAKPAS
ncbi:MAG: endopeptidase La [Gemmatimonadetes bacterium]|nr:endopeptidase La [Gemmatimonadota bacterium]